MKPIIIKNSKIPKLLSWVIDIRGITLWPFIILIDEGDERIIRHESIHIAQYNELFVVGFIALYLWDAARGLIKYKDGELAYRAIRFEQEAYAFDEMAGYLKTRTRYKWREFSV